MKRTYRLFIVLSCVVFLLPFTDDMVGFAQETTPDEIGELNETIKQKQQSIDQLNRNIEQVEQRIDEQQAQEATLSLELDLLENRVKKTELDIQSTEAQMDIVNAELVLLAREIHDLETRMDKDQQLVAGVLQKIEVQDRATPLEVIFGTNSFSEFFSAIEQLEAVSADLQKAVEVARTSKKNLEEKHESEWNKKNQLLSLNASLLQEQGSLNETMEAKTTLLTATQASEAQFQELVLELKEEQEYLNQQIAILQKEIEGKLDASDALGDASLLSWPLDPTLRGISVYFHDPTYPFRHLFEHSGLDLPASTGTPVKAAAPGYVAWTRQGTLYGNYVMVIHTGGIATLYAHLSRIDVSPEQFISRGDQLGAVGSTGLSTGPHLHFEVRKDGIPTDPLEYLIPF